VSHVLRLQRDVLLHEDVLNYYRQAYRPPGHAHGNMQEDRYISCSMVVSRTACEIYDDVVNPQPRNVPPYYTFRGDGLASAHAQALDELLRGNRRGRLFEEVQVETPLEDGWRLAGTTDALVELRDDDRTLYATNEYKSLGVGTDDKDNLARRQGLLYLAMWLHGDGQGTHAPWHPDAGEPIFREDPSTPLGTFVCIADDHAATGRVQFVPADEQTIKEVLNYYKDKAKHLQASFMDNSREWAEKWDRNHPDEFLPFDVSDDDAHNEAIRRYHEITGQLNELYGEKRQLEQYIDNVVLTDEHETYEGDGWGIWAPWQKRRSVKVGDAEQIAKDLRKLNSVSGAEAARLVEGIIKDGMPFRRRKAYPLHEEGVRG
jgi:hypothetical protein